MTVAAAKQAMNTKAETSGLLDATRSFEKSTLKRLNVDFEKVAEAAVKFKGNYSFLRGAGRFAIGAVAGSILYNMFGPKEQSQPRDYRPPWNRNDHVIEA